MAFIGIKYCVITVLEKDQNHKEKEWLINRIKLKIMYPIKLHKITNSLDDEH